MTIYIICILALLLLHVFFEENLCTQEKIYGYNKKYIISKFDDEFSIERNGATTAHKHRRFIDFLAAPVPQLPP